MSDKSTVFDVLDGFFQVLEPNEAAQSSRVLKKEIRFMERQLNKYERKWKKDGLSDLEKERIEKLRTAIFNKLMKL
jgi:hypothetical protein